MRTHLKSRTIKDRVALTTADGQTEQPLSSQRNFFESTRTNRVLTPNAGISVDAGTSPQNVVQQLSGVGATTNDATTQTNLVTNDQTTHSEDKKTTARDPLTSGKDPAVTEETTGSLTGRYMTDGDRTTQQEMTQGLTSPADETSSSSPVVENTEGPSRTLSGRGLTADGAKRATTADNNRLGMGDATEVVTDIVTITESPVVKEVEVTEVVTELDKTVKDVGYSVTDPHGLTTVVPTTEPQTTSSCKSVC